MKRRFSDGPLRADIAREIASMSRYFARLIVWSDRSDHSQEVLAAIDCPAKTWACRLDEIPSPCGDTDGRSLVVVDHKVDSRDELEQCLRRLKTRLSRGDRLVFVQPTGGSRFLTRLWSYLRMRGSATECSRLSLRQVKALAPSCGYEVVRVRPAAYWPFGPCGMGRSMNWVVSLTPVLRRASLARIIVLRPVERLGRKPSLSLIVPARNERGNIAPLLNRLADLDGAEQEVILVEGHSTDGTWEEMLRAVAAYAGRSRILTLQQKGKGKRDAVDLGIAHAQGELVAILDADLSVSPETIPQFYDAYCSGRGDLINGNRLQYPMEPGAMRPLNRLANSFFAWALRHVLDVPIGDTLCGTKLFARRDYARFQRWRQDVGAADPFGDFDLLFPAAALGVGVAEVAVHYAARRYGSTQISRFRDGWSLLRMTLAALFRIKAVR